MLVCQRLTEKYCRQKISLQCPPKTCTCCVHLHHIAPLARLPHAETKGLTCGGRFYWDSIPRIGDSIWDFIGCDPKWRISTSSSETLRIEDLGHSAIHVHNFCSILLLKRDWYLPHQKKRDGTSKIYVSSPSMGIWSSYEWCSSIWFLQLRWLYSLGIKPQKWKWNFDQNWNKGRRTANIWQVVIKTQKYSTYGQQYCTVSLDGHNEW